MRYKPADLTQRNILVFLLGVETPLFRVNNGFKHPKQIGLSCFVITAQRAIEPVLLPVYRPNKFLRFSRIVKLDEEIAQTSSLAAIGVECITEVLPQDNCLAA